MNKSDIIEVCVAVVYITTVLVIFLFYFDRTYFIPEVILALGIMLVLALVMRMSRFNIVGICAAAAYLATILVDIIYLNHDYIIIDWIALTIPLIIGKGKSSTIGICGALAYIYIIVATLFVFDRGWAIVAEIVLAFPFSICSFLLFTLMPDSWINWITSIILETIWIYFIIIFICSVIKAANSPPPDMNEDESESRNR